MSLKSNDEFTDKIVANIAETSKVLPLDVLVRIRDTIGSEIALRDQTERNRDGREI